MKASESSPQYTGKVRECTNYAVRGIKNLYKDPDLKSRQACSEGEAEIAQLFQKELETFCDTVVTEPFSADLSSNKVNNIFVFLFMLLSSAAIIGSNFIGDVILFASAGLSLLALASFMGLFSKFAKNRQSLNIIATRNALGVATHKVVFCANMDSPFKRTFSVLTEKVAKLLTLVGIILHLAFDAVRLCETYYNLFENPLSKIMPIISYVMVIFVFFPLIAAVSINTKNGTLGVANNLSGCFACLGAMRYLNEFGLKLDNTDISVVLTGAKNASNAGAKAYAKLHAQDDKKLSTLFVCVNTLSDVNFMSIQGGSLKGTKLIKLAADNANISLVENKAKYLKSDSAVFAKEGLASATVTTLGDTAPEFYYTNLDNVENIDVKSTESAINILLESAYLVDEKK